MTWTTTAFAALEGVECWIVDALRYTPHPSHAHLARTLEWIARVKPARAILTNMHVDLDYETLKRELPPGVEPAYDGMVAQHAAARGLSDSEATPIYCVPFASSA